MTARIYLVQSESDGPRLVKAKTRAQALSAIVKPMYDVEPADAVTVAEMVSGGAKVLDATSQVEDGAPEDAAPVA